MTSNVLAHHYRAPCCQRGEQENEDRIEHIYKGDAGHRRLPCIAHHECIRDTYQHFQKLFQKERNDQDTQVMI